MLTGNGRAVAAAGPLLLAAGAVTGWFELTMLGVACVLAVAAALWWLLRRPDLVVSREIAPARVSDGEHAVGTLTVTNVGARRSPPLLATEPVGGRRVGVRLPSLRPGGDARVSYDLPTDRRGVHAVGPLTLARSDPLRLVLAAREHGSRTVLAVHPRVHAVEPVPTGRARDMDGPTSLSAPQGGIAFHSLREYVPGDDLRLVHWRSTARAGQLMVRHNVVPNEPRLLVVLDTSAAPYTPASFEDAVRVAASLCSAACEAGFPLRLATTGGAVASAEARSAGPGPVLDLLAGVEASADDPGLAGFVRLLPDDDGVSLGVVTGQAPPGYLGLVAAARGRFDMVSIVQVGEEFDRAPAAVAGAFVVNCRTSDDFARVWNRGVRR
ncbi:MAG TPA: DUF58 domain-containing protein [Acidimicrobiales bacterium]|nr:DUF58 domain-containing protein [Acidimicrobiales bacterium]